MLRKQICVYCDLIKILAAGAMLVHNVVVSCPRLAKLSNLHHPLPVCIEPSSVRDGHLLQVLLPAEGGQDLCGLHTSRRLVRALCLHHVPRWISGWLQVLPPIHRHSGSDEVGQVELPLLGSSVKGLFPLDLVRCKHDDLRGLRVVLLFLVSGCRMLD